MAGTGKGGAQHFSVQEAQNVALGQTGSVLHFNGGDPIVPPKNHVFVAITFVTGSNFENSAGLVAQDPKRWFNSETAAHDEAGGSETESYGSGGVVTDTNTLGFAAGVTIYGRWTKIDLFAGACVAYIGK
jgi:hypothetical protein